MIFYDFLWLTYDLLILSKTHTWVSFLDRMSQSGSAAETFVEYKRDPISGTKNTSKPRQQSVCKVHLSIHLDPDTALCAKCTSLYPQFF